MRALHGTRIDIISCALHGVTNWLHDIVCQELHVVTNWSKLTFFFKNVLKLFSLSLVRLVNYFQTFFRDIDFFGTGNHNSCNGGLTAQLQISRV